MPTIREVASRSGVSVATVSRALNDRGRVSDQTRERVRRTAQELGYQPDELARHLVTRTTTTVAMVVPDITNPFFPELVDGVHRACHDRRHALMLLQSPEDPRQVEAVVDQLAGRRLAGTVLVGGALPGSAVAQRLGTDAVVVVDRAPDDVPEGIRSVRADHGSGGRLAGDHLVELGHRRIGHAAGPAGLGVADQRRQGLGDALREAGLDLPEDRVTHGDFSEASGYDAGRRLMDHHPDLTAVVCANDLMAIGVVRALDDLGLEVPGDVSVVGYDDIALARYVRPALTTVRQPTAGLGRLAVARLLDRDGPTRSRASNRDQETLMPVELVVRASTAPVSTAPPARRRRS